MRRVLVALLVALGVIATVSVGHAAQLTVSPGSISTVTITHPCRGADAVVVPAGPTSATSTFTGATVSLPAGCDGATVQISLLNGTTLVAQGVGQVVGTTATVTTTAPYVAVTGLTVQATVAGWGLPALWSWTAPSVGPITPGPNTDLQTSWQVVGPGQFCVTVTARVITSTSNGGDTWGANLNINEYPFNGATTGYTVTGDVYLGPAANGVIPVMGTGTKGKLKAGETITFTICHA